MPRFLRKLLSVRNLIFKPKAGSDEIAEERWTADFSKPKHARFDIKSESSYDANLQKFGSRRCLSLGIKKTRCIAWVEAPECRYRDQIIDARVRVDAHGGYAAAGLMFRMVDDKTYYSFLISNKGYFRLDVLRNGMPLPLIGWTELPDQAAAEIAASHAVDFTIIAYGSHIVLLVRGRWVAEINDSTIFEGSLCFTAASYDPSGDSLDDARLSSLLFSPVPESGASLYTAETFLESLTVDSRITEAAALYEKWSASPDIDPRCRFRLAETFTAMNQHKAAMLELRKAWDTPGYKPQQKELLLAGRLAQQLGLASEAEQYISQCFQSDVDTPEGKEAVTEMAKILYACERYKELKDYCAEAVKLRPDDPVLINFRGHAYWSLKEYKHAAAAYDRAFELDNENGLLAKNAANVYEVLGKKKEALSRYLAAGRVFLRAGNYDDLGLLVPKLFSLGEDSQEAHGLAGKWAFGIEDWKMAAREFEKADALRKKKRSRAPKDATILYLRALLLIQDGKRAEALPLLEEAASLEKDYPLFRFKLAENRFLLNDDPDDSALRADLEAALALDPGGGWINNFAAQLCLRKGDLESAEGYLDNAASALGDVPAIRVNKAELLSLKGETGEALKLLAVDKADDPDGMMANCAGNLLVRAGRYEEAGEYYRKALEAAPDTVEYLINRASCLIELGLYGEADSILTHAHSIAPSPTVLELISYVASKKGEFSRAEAACNQALEMESRHVPSLLSLAWVLINLGKEKEAWDCLARLDELDLNKGAAAKREELRARLDERRYTTVPCASCSRSWKILRNPPVVQGIRLFAMPPENLPAGSCVDCGKTWCIGCAKNHLDSSGRFICPVCGKPLRLVKDGLKKLIYDWAAENGLVGNAKRKRGRPRKNP
ncbi:MAG: tetratricopeptide repeat protein [Treponema sp.]|jgi:tetratricopeptide (TPR) repeat protein|nr:tetratricopeptide repeat protein [Treponema sp.]